MPCWSVAKIVKAQVFFDRQGTRIADQGLTSPNGLMTLPHIPARPFRVHQCAMAQWLKIAENVQPLLCSTKTWKSRVFCRAYVRHCAPLVTVKTVPDMKRKSLVQISLQSWIPMVAVIQPCFFSLVLLPLPPPPSSRALVSKSGTAMAGKLIPNANGTLYSAKEAMSSPNYSSQGHHG